MADTANQYQTFQDAIDAGALAELAKHITLKARYANLAEVTEDIREQFEEKRIFLPYVEEMKALKGNKIRRAFFRKIAMNAVDAGEVHLGASTAGTDAGDAEMEDEEETDDLPIVPRRAAATNVGSSSAAPLPLTTSYNTSYYTIDGIMVQARKSDKMIPASRFLNCYAGATDRRSSRRITEFAALKAAAGDGGWKMETQLYVSVEGCRKFIRDNDFPKNRDMLLRFLDAVELMEYD